MEVTLTPVDLRMVPTLLAMTPLPIPLMTPPVTKMYFIASFPTNLASVPDDDYTSFSTIVKKIKLLKTEVDRENTLQI